MLPDHQEILAFSSASRRAAHYQGAHGTPKVKSTDTALPGQNRAAADNLVWANVALSVLSAVLTFVYLDTTVDAALEASGAGLTGRARPRRSAFAGALLLDRHVSLRTGCWLVAEN